MGILNVAIRVLSIVLSSVQKEKDDGKSVELPVEITLTLKVMEILFPLMKSSHMKTNRFLISKMPVMTLVSPLSKNVVPTLPPFVTRMVWMKSICPPFITKVVTPVLNIVLSSVRKGKHDGKFVELPVEITLTLILNSIHHMIHLLLMVMVMLMLMVMLVL